MLYMEYYKLGLKRRDKIRVWITLITFAKIIYKQLRNRLRQRKTSIAEIKCVLMIRDRFLAIISSKSTLLHNRIRNDLRYTCQMKTTSSYGVSYHMRAIQTVLVFLRLKREKKRLGIAIVIFVTKIIEVQKLFRSHINKQKQRK